MQYIEAKNIVTKTKNNLWFGTDYNMNIYRGCTHGCIYCDSRSDCYRNENFENIKVKAHSLDIISANLRSKCTKGVIGTGAMSDPYNTVEQQLGLTRGALELVNDYRFGIAISTKSSLIARDVDVLKAITKHSPVICKVTITTYDSDLCSIIEPNVSSTVKRLETIATLAQNGIYCGVLLMPLLPFINDNRENVFAILHAAKSAGASFVYPYFGVTLRDSQRKYFYDRLDEHFPNMKQRYISTFGDSYACQQYSTTILYRDMEAEAHRIGILCRMQDIIRDYRGRYQKNDDTKICQQELF
ncbi:MAG: radical SAM protein [Bacteroidales bacterium]|jgi:DNA repair photolyase|nr:radical SAM protein [Bacteroidales bacterium]